jgi:hypothetical protein
MCWLLLAARNGDATLTIAGRNPSTDSLTAKHYLRTQRLQYLQPVTQRISDWIEQEAAKASGANVVPLHVGAA